MDKADVDRWLEAYVAAWKSYDRDQIARLFAEDVSYRYHPYDEPVTGRAAVVRSWLGEVTEGDTRATDEAGSQDAAAWAKDEAGTYDAAYRAVAVDGDVAVATGSSRYFAWPGGPLRKVYDNCFVMRFNPDGLCREFTEWFIERPDS